jgi:hypothetical protein
METSDPVKIKKVFSFSDIPYEEKKDNSELFITNEETEESISDYQQYIYGDVILK